MAAETGAGSFVWCELMTTDPGAAKRFYTDVVGWTTQQWDNPEFDYTMWVAGETPVGGVMELPEEARSQGAPPHWLAYASVADADAATARVRERGGKVYVEPTDIPGVGRFAVYADPQGAVFAVLQPERPAESGPPAVGQFSWFELATDDPEAAFDFYADLLGWERTGDFDMGPEAGVYQMYGQEGRPYGGIYRKPAEMPGPSAWLCYARVQDVDQAAERVRARGGQVLNGPMEVPGGDWIVQCLDPQGAAFALHERAGAR